VVTDYMLVVEAGLGCDQQRLKQYIHWQLLGGNIIQHTAQIRVTLATTFHLVLKRVTYHCLVVLSAPFPTNLATVLLYIDMELTWIYITTAIVILCRYFVFLITFCI
jgi:hypothetical protein